MNILVISHAANRSGAPLSLLAFLRWLHGQPEHKVWIQTLRSGPIEAPFYEVAQNAELDGLRRASLLEALARRFTPARFFIQILEVLNAKTAQAASEWSLQDNAIDLVLLNSVASGAVLDVLNPLLQKHRIPVAVWVHELAGARAQFSGEWERIKPVAQRFIAASQAVKKDLIREGIAAEKIEVAYEMVDGDAIQVDQEKSRLKLREQLGLQENAFVVGSCGTPETRKGFDLWPRIASEAPECHFVWLGASEANQAVKKLLENSEQANEGLHLMPPTATPAEFFAGLDVFCLPSREDPFPLVAIEAAMQGVPIACFEGAGGIPEMVGDRGGIVVALEDVTAMGRALRSLRLDTQFREQLGRNVRKRAYEMCDVKNNGPLLLKILRNVAKL